MSNLTINGANFGGASDAGAKIGGIKYSLTSLFVNGGGTQITGTLTLPSIAVGKGQVYVTVGGVDFLGPTFWCTNPAAPNFTATPNNGSQNGGTAVALAGSGLTGWDIPGLGALTVSDGTRTLAPTSDVYVSDTSSTLVTASDAPNSGTGVVTVTTPSGTGTAPYTYNGWDPRNVAGCVLYLNASTPQAPVGPSIVFGTLGTDVQQWTDQSGGNHHFTNATQSKRPTLSAAGVNGNPSVHGDGATAGQALTCVDTMATILGANTFAEKFVLGKLNAASSNNFDGLNWGSGSDSPRYQTSTTAEDGQGFASSAPKATGALTAGLFSTPFIHNVQSTNGAFNILVNSNTVFTTATNTLAAGGLAPSIIGNGSGVCSPLELRMVLVFARTSGFLSTAERAYVLSGMV